MFKKKQVVKVADLCRKYYEKNVFNSIKLSSLEQARQAYCEEDPYFASASPKAFISEATSLQLELFAVAWVQSNQKTMFAQSAYTKEYLDSTGNRKIWDGMEPYNLTISRSTIRDKSDFDKARILKGRADQADAYIEIAQKNNSPVDETAGRPINRVSTKPLKEQTMVLDMTLAFCENLGIDARVLNENTRFRIMLLVGIFYRDAIKALEEVNII